MSRRTSSPFVLPQLEERAGSSRNGDVTGRDVDAVERDPECGRARRDVARAADDREVDDIAPPQDLGGAEYARVLSFGQHDVPAVALRPLQHLVLEHDRRHPRRPFKHDPSFELSSVDARLEEHDGSCDLALASAAYRPAA